MVVEVVVMVWVCGGVSVCLGHVDCGGGGGDGDGVGAGVRWCVCVSRTRYVVTVTRRSTVCATAASMPWSRLSTLSSSSSYRSSYWSTSSSPYS